MGIAPKQLDEIKATFAKFDTDGDGKISLDELTAAMNADGKVTSKMEAKMLMNQVDKKRTGFITLEAFITYMTTPSTQIRDIVRERFNVFDRDGDGFITRDEMNAIVNELQLGDEWTEAVISKLFADADTNGDGMIDFDGKHSVCTHVAEFRIAMAAH